MKKFVFTLESVYKVRTAREKQKKQEYGKLQELQRRMSAEKEALEKNFEENAQKYRCDITGSLSTTEAANYIGYFSHVTQQTAELDKRIQDTEKEKHAVLEELVGLMKEIRTLDRLREVQLAEYKESLAKEEEKAVGDLVSFQSIAAEKDIEIV